MKKYEIAMDAKMDARVDGDAEYLKETKGKEFALRFHLETNFYPNHPKWVVDRFVKSFKKYWKHKDLEKLNKSLSDIYSCDWSRYGFYNFLNKEDLWGNTIN